MRLKLGCVTQERLIKIKESFSEEDQEGLLLEKWIEFLHLYSTYQPVQQVTGSHKVDSSRYPRLS